MLGVQLAQTKQTKWATVESYLWDRLPLQST